jgi:thiamine-phosphate pyrophosphorylase
LTGTLDTRLQAILDIDVAERAGWTPHDLGRALLDGGARLVQIRAKQLASGPLLTLCDQLVDAARPRDASILVNDRADLARLSRAAGVHVGQDDLSPAAARTIVGPTAVVGFSTHGVEQVRAALTQPVSYIAVGPVFGTSTKATGHDAVGLSLVAAAARLAGSIPIVAIGGITLENARSVLDAGATMVAVISDLMTGGDPGRRVDAYLRALA